MTTAKQITHMTVADLETYPVWQYVDAPDGDETWVQPIALLPTTDLRGKVIGAKVCLADGTMLWAILSNVHVGNVVATELFLSLSIDINGRWFHLARYFDIDFEERSPLRLAEALGRPVSGVFPIKYDIRFACLGDRRALLGEIQQAPGIRLSEEEIAKMAVQSSLHPA